MHDNRLHDDKMMEKRCNSFHFSLCKRNNSQILKFVIKSNIFLIGATGFGASFPLCRAFECLSLQTYQKVEEKLANVQKRAYLCIVKTEQQVLHDKNKQQ